MTDNKPYERKRPSERIFRRSRAARARRTAGNKSDFRFITMLLQVSVLAALMLVGVGVWMQKSMSGEQADLSNFASLADPWKFGLTYLEAGGIAVLVTLSVILLIFWKLRGANR